MCKYYHRTAAYPILILGFSIENDNEYVMAATPDGVGGAGFA
jgi:hypothetical protein